MKTRTIIYWVTTGLLCAVLTFGGLNEVSHSDRIMGVMAHLGYPPYLPTLLGSWKILGVIAVLAPRATRLKEWAYAGMFFDFTGAIFSHLNLGDGSSLLGPPVVLLLLAIASWSTRPANRKLAAPTASTAA